VQEVDDESNQSDDPNWHRFVRSNVAENKTAPARGAVFFCGTRHVSAALNSGAEPRELLFQLLIPLELVCVQNLVGARLCAPAKCALSGPTLVGQLFLSCIPGFVRGQRFV
jgi:hypothetical protein